MFTTFVKVCSVVAITECTEFEDTLGPYNTRKECEIRAYEMAQDLMTVIKPPVEYSYKCATDNKGHAA